MQQQNIPGGIDEIRINVGDMFELKFWAKRFDVTPTELKSVVKSVGDVPSAVRSQIEMFKKNLSPQRAV
ncbi:DUF3606 domain-containing protein [Pseudomonas sp. HS6]|uniref:DUF3606 domain-containing protein n=1 Tax=Pseudomonas sp. HS6 TaxID=2850559 RepID=UPI00201A2038|nr:DUF3606 domain-containing protein [Pseudomonas sp. HS6]UQS16151.1 DUF3606 domain-containing protein [Pseudomonas sp. HS6]